MRVVVLCLLDLCIVLVRHQSDIQALGRKEKISIGGAGGITTQDGYVLPDLTLTIGSHSATIDPVRVDTGATFEGPESRIGCNLGQDVPGQFGETVLSIHSMSMLFR